MGKIALWCALIFLSPAIALAGEQTPVSQALKKQLLGAPVYIQIFKEERQLELYAQLQGEYRLLDTYQICDFSGGLGPKRLQGDFKSPEGFYSIDMRHLKPDSKFYRAINIGFPNDYDKAQGYSGNYLMIHGECKSIGCYAMTNAYMDEIFTYVRSAFVHGQKNIDISIYPFKMTPENMQRHRTSNYIDFWRQLQPGYTYFAKNHQPPQMNVKNGQYVLNTHPVDSSQSMSQLALTEKK